MNILKRILQALNDNALVIHETVCNTYTATLGPDTHQICRHCGQNVTDKNINHASTGCTVTVKEL